MHTNFNDLSDPEVHPQPETYWGHVNTIGSRACYDEGKRVAETMCYAYAKQVILLKIYIFHQNKYLCFVVPITCI